MVVGRGGGGGVYVWFMCVYVCVFACVFVCDHLREPDNACGNHLVSETTQQSSQKQFQCCNIPGHISHLRNAMLWLA